MSLAIAALLALVVSACGSGGNGGNGATSSPTAPTATATPKITHAGQTADQILQGLKAKGLPIGASFTYDASNDQNHLLGRPGQYIGKLEFTDTRISSTDQGPDISVDDGGSIEVFANAADAQKRANYVKGIASSSALFAEYDYLDGVVLLRVSKQLTPTQASAYQSALVSLP